MTGQVFIDHEDHVGFHDLDQFIDDTDHKELNVCCLVAVEECLSHCIAVVLVLLQVLVNSLLDPDRVLRHAPILMDLRVLVKGDGVVCELHVEDGLCIFEEHILYDGAVFSIPQHRVGLA